MHSDLGLFREYRYITAVMQQLACPEWPAALTASLAIQDTLLEFAGVLLLSGRVIALSLLKMAQRLKQFR